MEEQIIQLKEEGKSYRQIAELLKITDWRVRVTLNPHLLKGENERIRDSRLLKEEKKRATEVIEVARVKRNNEIIELFEQGYTYPELANKFNLSLASIYLIVKDTIAKHREKQREANSAEYEVLCKTVEYKKIKTITIFKNGEIYNKGKRLPQIKHIEGNCIRYFVLIPNGKGGYKEGFVHRLVALAFVPNETGYNYVVHLDGNPKNNNAENLKWDYPRTKERRTENMHKIQPFLDSFDYENSEYMCRNVYNFLKTGHEFYITEIFQKERNYFMKVILNECNNHFTKAKQAYEWQVENMIDWIRRGYYIPRIEDENPYSNARFICWARSRMKWAVIMHYNHFKETSYNENKLEHNMSL